MEEEVGYWKQNLYLLQEAAPRPFPVKCMISPESSPPQVPHLLFFFSIKYSSYLTTNLVVDMQC